jgi:hypothetical protein
MCLKGVIALYHAVFFLRTKFARGLGLRSSWDEEREATSDMGDMGHMGYSYYYLSQVFSSFNYV